MGDEEIAPWWLARKETVLGFSVPSTPFRNLLWFRATLRAAVLVLGVGALLAGLPTAPALSETVMPAVIDGDTIQTTDGIHHLAGIDAPELGQRCRQAGRWIHCGKDAAFALHRVLSLSLEPLVCTPLDGAVVEAGGAHRSTCAISGHKDIAMVLLTQGLAITAPDAPGAYREAQEKAKAAGLGLWRTDFVRPWDWRRGGRLPDDPVVDPPPCPIKATTAEGGDGVFLVPLDAGYAAVPDDAVEARYCSDDEALSDGWGRPPLPTP
jgi:endonuclease YncB( thermonuclease family)